MPIDYWATREATPSSCATSAAGPGAGAHRLGVDYAVWLRSRPTPARDRLAGRTTSAAATATSTTAPASTASASTTRWPASSPSRRSRRTTPGPAPTGGTSRDIPRQVRGNEDRPHPRRRLRAVPHLQGAARPGAGLHGPVAQPGDRPLLPGQALRPGLRDTRRIYEQIPGQVMITYVAEDMGGQDGPDDLGPPHPRVPAAADEAHDRPGPPGRRLRLPPQRRQLLRASSPT